MSISPGQGICGNDIIPLSSLQLIGISGHAGVGKDTVARYIQEKYKDVWIEHFADPLKRACAEAFGIPIDWFHEPELKEQETFWGVTPRKIAQFVGTEMFRDVVPKLYGKLTHSHWVIALSDRLTGKAAPPSGQDFYAPGETILIPDVRFQDEADWIWNNGGLVLHIQRKGYEGKVGIQGHASEVGYKPNTMADVAKHWVIYNDFSLEEFYAAVDLFIQTFIGQGMLKLVPEPKEINGFSIDI